MESAYLHAWNVVIHEDRKNLDQMRIDFGSYEKAWKYATEKNLAKYFLKERISAYISEKKQIDPVRLYDKMPKKFRLVTCIDSEYPELLRHIKNYPAGIYIQGKMDPKRFFLSIVGTRKNSPYGEVHTKRIISDLRQYPFTIVSGLARGIDTIAHREAVRNNLPTVAVLGYGFDFLPFHKFKLIREILEKNGALISEYPPDRPGQKYYFPERNRIIAGLSSVTVVTEAPEKSGALITANAAFFADRNVLAMPGNIDIENSQGCNRLIKEQKASLLTDASDILKEFRIEPMHNQQALPLIHHEHRKIYDCLTPSVPKNFDNLVSETGESPDKILYSINALEIDQKIKKIPGGYIKIPKL